MSETTAHIINHTHWDREWFLTSVYTSRWIPGLVDKLERLAEDNDRFQFLFDGQTLVIEDLLAVAPGYEAIIHEMVGSGRLQIGPYYCQPDWQLTSGELLIRNLVYGQSDLARYGGQMATGWMVDTFGHISQSPQIHQMFEIGEIFVWRGVPRLEPYFNWLGADGSQMLTVNLFGGYRNLYGVSHAPEAAVKRIEAEIDKLKPFYPTPDIPMFDGYDLEDNPEDPMRFFESLGGVRKDIVLQESTPALFMERLASKGLNLPTIEGELNSGKYGATFPGVFSARTYLKVMAHDCERMLFKVCEPLGSMGHLFGRPYDAAQYEAWGRLLLQNAVHDCICGVSIDQVHEKMEFGYRKAFEEMNSDVQEVLEVIMADFAPGVYAVSSNPFAGESWQMMGRELVKIETNGVGVWPISERAAVDSSPTPTDLFVWSNDFYEASVSSEGLVRIGDALLGEMVVDAEHGDTYSDEAGERLGRLAIGSELTLEESSDHHALISYSARWDDGEREASAEVHILFDESALVKWEIELDSKGSNLSVDLLMDTAVSGQISAGMPFDNVMRPLIDDDLLPRELPDDLASVLLGQRELNSVTMFPFHDYVSVDDGEAVVSVLAKGLRGYRAEAGGVIVLPLRRSVEWLTAVALENRDGDAGPFFYVPDARCERRVKHEVAAAFGLGTAETVVFQAANAAYQNPPILVENEGKGGRRSWQLWQEDLPLSALTVQNGLLLGRIYNPANQTRELKRTYQSTNVWGDAQGAVNRIAAKQILTVALEAEGGVEPGSEGGAEGKMHAVLPPWRVGENQGRPETAILAELARDAAAMQTEIAALEVKLAGAEGSAQLRLQHRIYVVRREMLEAQLSLVLNERKLEQDGRLDEVYLYEPDAEIAELGLALNRMRIRRRIFDYVVEAVGKE